MAKLNLVKALSFLVALSGALVAVGWILDIGVLKSVLPGLVAMKLTTAVCFVASGVVLFVMAKEEESETSLLAQLILPATSLLIFLLMATFFVSVIFGLDATGMDNIFIKEKVGAVNTFVPGRPSIPTMFNFILIAVTGTIAMAGFKKHLPWLGVIVALIGGIAVLGYIINQPLLYYLVVEKNTAMALNTAVLFVLIGIGFILCKKSNSKQN